VTDSLPEILENVPLAPLTTLEVGGPARFFCRCPDDQSLKAALAWAAAREAPVFVLGGGSNVLIADRGFEGLVVQPNASGVEIESKGTRARVRAAAGQVWDELVAQTVAAGLAGIEALSGIPGRCGAAPIQNIGAYGQELARALHAVEAVDRTSLESVVLDAKSCGFGYRTSRFKRADRGRFVITAVVLELPKAATGRVAYPELVQWLGLADAQEPVTLTAIREAVLAVRRTKSMVLDPADPNRRSVGSFFLNPIVSPELADRIARKTVVTMPRYPAPDGVKLSAAWLIEQAGFVRGSGVGAVGLSSRHTLAIVNRGAATAAALRDFAERLRDQVAATFGVVLEAEPTWVGFAEPVAKNLKRGLTSPKRLSTIRRPRR
jgi:UDP-N-acetylmuramate dehydrogenase